MPRSWGSNVDGSFAVHHEWGVMVSSLKSLGLPLIPWRFPFTPFPLFIHQKYSGISHKEARKMATFLTNRCIYTLFKTLRGDLWLPFHGSQGEHGWMKTLETHWFISLNTTLEWLLIRCVFRFNIPGNCSQAAKASGTLGSGPCPWWLD